MQKKILIFMLLVMTLSSCTYYAYQRLLHIRMGMTSDQVFEVLTSSEYNDDDVLMINGSEDLYDISNKLGDSKNIKVLIAQKYQILQDGDDTPYYVFTFENDKLVYWGMPLEYGRLENANLNKIGEVATNIIKEKYLD